MAGGIEEEEEEEEAPKGQVGEEKFKSSATVTPASSVTLASGGKITFEMPSDPFSQSFAPSSTLSSSTCSFASASLGKWTYCAVLHKAFPKP